jgi:hypothetical protein
MFSDKKTQRLYLRTEKVLLKFDIELSNPFMISDFLYQFHLICLWLKLLRKTKCVTYVHIYRWTDMGKT